MSDKTKEEVNFLIILINLLVKLMKIKLFNHILTIKELKNYLRNLRF